MEDTDRDNRHPYFDNWFDHEQLCKKRRKWSKISDPFEQVRVFLEFGLICTELMRAKSSWSIVQAAKLDFQIPETKFESFE